MIAPVAPFTIRGAIWYQGESNAGPANRGNMDLYGQLFPTMILSWRYEFSRAQGIPREESEFPFLFVQLANFRERRAGPTDSYWAQIREAQTGTLEIPRTGMAVAIDIGEANDIHPKNKQEVGRRLMLAALAQVYFNEIEYSGPLFGGMQIEDGKVRLNFSNADGLKSSDGGPIKGFALAGEDRKFHWANAVIEGDHVVITCPDVPAPVAVRYGWADNPDCNLVNGAGLPASPFRSDKWKQEPPPGSAGS
jgi:sialate O-acetylesterase